MKTARRLVQGRLRADKVDAYVRYHQAVWPELLEAYRQAGITRISCFLHGVDLFVYSEFEVETYEREKEALRRHPVEVRWQALMATLRDPDFAPVEYTEVFHM